MAKQQRTVLVASNILLAVVLIAIWLLTVQTPQDTTALSTPWAQALSSAFGWSLSSAAWVARKIVHTVEFFPVGLLMALVAYNLPQTKDMPRNRVLAAVILICFACSLGDQVHKAFVPGREFDALDMCFDAVGYVLGALIARAAAARMR
ncbi:MAG: VanZ family protein [Eggerthellaceae bacterium]|jgi:VanZ family protein